MLLRKLISKCVVHRLPSTCSYSCNSRDGSYLVSVPREFRRCIINSSLLPSHTPGVNSAQFFSSHAPSKLQFLLWPITLSTKVGRKIFVTSLRSSLTTNARLCPGQQCTSGRVMGYLSNITTLPGVLLSSYTGGYSRCHRRTSHTWSVAGVNGNMSLLA